MLKILKVSLAVTAVTTGIYTLSLYLFKDAGFVIGTLICMDIVFSWLFIIAVREQIYITKLHKKGCRTDGTLTKIAYENRGKNHISYQADGKQYELKSGRKFGKWKVGYNKILILYDPKCPENACLEKYDLVSAISDTVIFALLETLFIGSTIYTIILSIELR